MSDTHEDNIRLKNATAWQYRSVVRAQKLGDIARAFVKNRTRKLKKNAQIADIWQELLPPEFYKYCRAIGIERSALIIEVQPGPFMYQMDRMKEQLLEYLQQHCPGAGIKSIKLTPAGKGMKNK